MAQLTDDCFAFSGPLLRLDEMERLIAQRVSPVVEMEWIPLHGATGRVIAVDVRAPVNLPPFDNSAVDGYAVRHADLRKDGDSKLTIKGRATAGARERLSLRPGEAIRIFTGAAMPEGADTVFMQEDVSVDGQHVIVPEGLKVGANRRLAGEDIRAGAVVFPAGTVLGVQHIALAAALGLTGVVVRRLLKVAIFSTGDEVVEPGAARGDTAIYDSNRFLITELLERLGAIVTDLGILRDNPDTLVDALQKATGHDLILTSGGVSTGEADHVRSAVERSGSLVFWRVAIKPGRPVAMGVIRDITASESAAFVGLPGNPVAVFVTFVRVVKPLLRRLSGARQDKLLPLSVRTAFAYRKKKDRREYVRVSLRQRADGEIEAVKHRQDGAGILTSLTETDGLLEFPEDVTTIELGDQAGFLSYAALIG
ncbi:MAG TPA: gephyrin-like molybdotransferase Glp [Pseudolabrys sp.]|jgi:molybdopterin molybdotransferase|nr:gephyrin-like molybdotransferase Glp [Pseudolabrys sp.]